MIKDSLNGGMAEFIYDWRNRLVKVREAVVGIINLDYRSLYHHFECAVYMYGTDCIREIEEDFQKCITKSRQVTGETVRHEKLRIKLTGRQVKAIAPLL